MGIQQIASESYGDYHVTYSVAPVDHVPRRTLTKVQGGAVRSYVGKDSGLTVNGHPTGGRTAYDLALQAGYVGTPEQWHEALKGPKEMPEVDIMDQFRKWEDDFIAANLRLATEHFDYGTPDKVYIPPDIVAIRNTASALIVAAVLLLCLVLVTLAAA